MPPDRTTPSFAVAQHLSLPLSSHGPAHAPSLARGNACLVCRTRKIKCDGVKPACSACKKSATAHGEDPESIVCNFDEPERVGDKRKRASGANKVATLEAKIAELERAIATASAQHQGSGAPTASYLDLSKFSTSAAGTSSASPPGSLEALLEASGSQAFDTQTFFNNAAPAPNPYDFSMPPLSMAPAPPPVTMESAPVTPPDDLLELFYPGWPKDLPSPALVSRLVDVYFSKSHAATGMVNQRKLLAALALPPTHANFPHPALLHAMLATASRMVSVDFFVGEDFYWIRNGDPMDDAADYHAKRAKVAIDEAICKGNRLFQIMQATVLICYYSYSSARFVEVWLYCGLATRMSTPLGLNHIRVHGKDAVRPTNVKASLLPPTDDEEELYERSATFWFGVICDRFASASTGWALSLDDADITSLLPSPGPAYVTDDLTTSPLSTHNPNFLMSHPPHLVQSLQLYIKAIVLLGRVVCFLQRAPAPTGMGLPPPGVQQQDQIEKFDVRTTGAFKRLDADAVTFRLSIPREYQTMQQSLPDSRLCLVFAVPHVATILLHESFCTMDDSDVSLARCLLSARAILNAIHSLWSTSFEIGLLAPFLNFCWAVAGRTLVRELAIKQAKKQRSGIEQLKSDVSYIITAMRACRSPLGDSSAHSLQALLDNPDACLPQAGTGQLFGPSASTCPLEESLFNVKTVGPSYQRVSSSSGGPNGQANHISPYASSGSNDNSPAAGSASASESASASVPPPVDFTAFLLQGGTLPDQAALFGDSGNSLQQFLSMDEFQWSSG